MAAVGTTNGPVCCRSTASSSTRVNRISPDAVVSYRRLPFVMGKRVAREGPGACVAQASSFPAGGGSPFRAEGRSSLHGPAQICTRSVSLPHGLTVVVIEAAASGMSMESVSKSFMVHLGTVACRQEMLFLDLVSRDVASGQLDRRGDVHKAAGTCSVSAPFGKGNLFIQ